MKKYYLTGVLLFLFLGSYAQVTIRPGFRAGANFSRITGTYYDSRTDFYFGALGEIKFSKFFFLQPEIGFSRQGAKGDVYRQPAPGSGNINKEELWFRKNIEANYITMGATAKFALSPEFRFLVGVSGEQALEQFEPMRHDVDMAALMGVEYKFPFGLGMEVRLKRGMLDMIDSREYETMNSRRSWLWGDRNLNLVLQAGLNFSLGH